MKSNHQGWKHQLPDFTDYKLFGSCQLGSQLCQEPWFKELWSENKANGLIRLGRMTHAAAVMNGRSDCGLGIVHQKTQKHAIHFKKVFKNSV